MFCAEALEQMAGATFRDIDARLAFLQSELSRAEDRVVSTLINRSGDVDAHLTRSGGFFDELSKASVLLGGALSAVDACKQSTQSYLERTAASTQLDSGTQITQDTRDTFLRILVSCQEICTQIVSGCPDDTATVLLVVSICFATTQNLSREGIEGLVDSIADRVSELCCFGRNMSALSTSPFLQVVPIIAALVSSVPEFSDGFDVLIHRFVLRLAIGFLPNLLRQASTQTPEQTISDVQKALLNLVDISLRSMARPIAVEPLAYEGSSTDLAESIQSFYVLAEVGSGLPALHHDCFFEAIRFCLMNHWRDTLRDCEAVVQAPGLLHSLDISPTAALSNALRDSGAQILAHLIDGNCIASLTEQWLSLHDAYSTNQEKDAIFGSVDRLLKHHPGSMFCRCVVGSLVYALLFSIIGSAVFSFSACALGTVIGASRAAAHSTIPTVDFVIETCYRELPQSHASLVPTTSLSLFMLHVHSTVKTQIYKLPTPASFFLQTICTLQVALRRQTGLDSEFLCATLVGLFPSVLSLSLSYLDSVHDGVCTEIDAHGLYQQLLFCTDLLSIAFSHELRDSASDSSSYAGFLLSSPGLQRLAQEAVQTLFGKVASGSNSQARSLPCLASSLTLYLCQLRYSELEHASVSYLPMREQCRDAINGWLQSKLSSLLPADATGDSSVSAQALFASLSAPL